MIYGVDRDDDWTDEALWAKANPSLSITVPIEKVRAAANSAKQNPAEENTFRQLRLNQWVKQSVRWMSMHVWNQNSAPIDLSDREGRVCYSGLDLASTTDITAFALVFPPQTGDEAYVIAPWFWIPEDNLKLRVARDHVPYDLWQQQGSCRPRRATWCTTGISRSSLRILAPGLISDRLLSTGGVLSK